MDGLLLILVGMGGVFTFLILVMCAIMGMSVFFSKSKDAELEKVAAVLGVALSKRGK